MKLSSLISRASDFLARRSAECIAYDEVFGAIGDAAQAPGQDLGNAARPPFRAADADAYFKDVFAGSAL